MISIDEIREGLDRLPSMISGGPGTRGPTEYVRRQDVLSMLDKMKEVAMSGFKAEINRSCTPEQAKSIREVFESQGWVEGVDFIDHTDHGTKCYSKEEMEAFREMLMEASMVGSVAPQSEVPEYVDLAKLYEAQKMLRTTGFDFCDQCGATNPKHGFYPLHHSHAVWNGELVESVSSMTCN